MKSIYDMFSLQMQAKNLKFKIFHSADMPEIIVSDERRLKQVLINLISNALKFTSIGQISVQSKFNKESRMLSIDVIDTGVGIKKADQVQLFKMFGKLQYTSK